MNKSSSRGIKLTTVIFAVIILALSAVISNTLVAGNTDITEEQT
ncbi:hypothetical protein [Thalassotalea piscium]|uniref:Uncharacterized protein n=1 Tax=Thalassotalea piscium TaxID=1230533 RepID=A0A7X0TV41_9GAMM|nr:hypothetical protein [Thalassotalea piscium]MBB6544740.1 hypothetical protein [Thalassotalea piscium]